MPFFTVTWRIENFSMCTQRVGDALTSPSFDVPSVAGVRWSMLMYPKGDGSVRDHISCHLQRTDREPGSDVNEFILLFTFINLDPVLSWTLHDDLKRIGRNETVCYSKLLSHHELFTAEAKGFLPRDTLTMRMHICPRFEGVTPLISPFIEVAFLSYSYSPHFTSEECFSNFNKTGDIALTQCSFLTRVPVERRILYWRIQDVRAKGKEKTSVDFESGFDEGIKLILCCRVVKCNGGRNESLTVEVLRKGLDLGRNFIKCEITIFDSDDIAREVVKFDHFFGKGYTRWSMPLIKNLNACKYIRDDDTFKLKLEFHISYDARPPRGGLSPLESEARNMLEHEDTCDASFECQNGNKFPVHKFLLCAKSPVFRAMFASDTLEKRTGVVRMSDTGTSTVRHLRDFLYTSSIPSKTEDVLGLYSVADKYNIETLKSKCADFLKNDLSVDSVCDVLTVADMHGDEGLKTYAGDFVVGEMDLDSEEWRKFAEENAALAAETLKNCVVKMKRDC